MFTLADVVHFLTNQFTRLCAGALSLSCIFLGSLNRLFIGHELVLFILYAGMSTHAIV